MTTAIINVGPEQQVGYTVCIDGSQSYSQGNKDKNPEVVNDIFEIAHYSWDFGDGTGVKSGEYLNTITHVYNKLGTYTVTLTVTDYAGRSATTSKSVAVKTLPKVTVSGSSTSAIVSAISSLGGKTGIVHLPTGIYSISSKFNIPSSVILEGAGMTKTQLRNTGTKNTNFITGDNVRITGIEFKGSGSNHGIWCTKKNQYMDHCEMHGFSYTNHVSYGGSATYEYNNIHDNIKSGAGYGITTSGIGSYAMIRYNELVKNRHSVAGGGMGSGYDFFHNHIHTQHVDSMLDVHCGGSGRVRVCDNLFENNLGSSAMAFANSWGEIRRNTFKNVLRAVNLQLPYHNGVYRPEAGSYNRHIDHNTFINCPTPYYWIQYTDSKRGGIYINCRKVDNLIIYKGNAPWDDCVAVYGNISGIITSKSSSLLLSGVTITANGYTTTTE